MRSPASARYLQSIRTSASAGRGRRALDGADQARRVPKASLEELFTKVQAGEEQELRLVLKADVQGSLEPIVNSINELPKGVINVNMIFAETGNISENDVMLASASKAIIIGFNVHAEVRHPPPGRDRGRFYPPV